MARFIKKQDGNKGHSPEALTFIGARRLDEPVIEVFDYKQNQLRQMDPADVHQLEAFKNVDCVSWINIDGLHDVEFIKKVGEIFDLHLLLLEDILDTSQRANFEEFDNCLFIVLKMLSCPKGQDQIEVEHISLVVSENYLLSFQEGITGDVFNPIRERMSRPTSKIRTNGTHYLAYSLLDVIIDNYIDIIERFGEKIEKLERKLMENQSSTEILQEINNYKIEINFLRKTIRPVRELAILFAKSDSELIDETMRPYLKNLVDHTSHATESIETYQIMLNDQLNIYQTSISNKLNEILRVLTVFSVIFIPLTFIAGVYGTNFEYLPELKMKYAYPMFWALMVTIVGIMLYLFKRKKWL